MRAQSSFLAEFKQAFNKEVGQKVHWFGGQVAENCAAFVSPYPCRRAVGVRTTERFELGDASVSYLGWKVIIEFDSKGLSPSNILKYWPYLRGELNIKPAQPIIFCHFSDWCSWATSRDLWEWTLSRMQADQELRVEIKGKQFDHGGSDQSLRASSISSAIKWIASVARADRGGAV
ncbi:MAG: hypothetical protein FWD79_08420 [Desulfobulbus sp.]|nr:hypothetical protein [Desulfobulbus sp.]